MLDSWEYCSHLIWNDLICFVAFHSLCCGSLNGYGFGTLYVLPIMTSFLLTFRWRKWSLHWRTKLSIVDLSPPLTQTCLHGAHLNIWRKASGLSVLLQEGDMTDFLLKKKRHWSKKQKSIKCGLYTFDSLNCVSIVWVAFDLLYKYCIEPTHVLHVCCVFWLESQCTQTARDLFMSQIPMY